MHSRLRTQFAVFSLLVGASHWNGATQREGWEENKNVAFCLDKRHRTFSKRGTFQDLNTHYQIKATEKLGEGTFAVVRKGIDRSTKEEVAVKEIDKSKTDEQTMLNEANIMKRMGTHPNLISLRNVYESQTTLYLIQDLADGGELFDRIVAKGELSEKEAVSFFKDACEAIRHLHERHICHLDIKPENLLLKTVNNEERVVLADFGLAIFAGKGNQAGEIDISVGTPAYWAAEMIKREKFSINVDIWALGCVLYILLCGSHPFDPTGETPDAQILSQVVNGDYDKSNAQYLKLSDSARDLIFHMLEKDPAKRYTIHQVLQHPWITESHSDSATTFSREYFDRIRGFRIVTLMKSGMMDLLGKAENDMFNALDVDGDGFLSREEIVRALSILGFQAASKEDYEMELEAFLKLADTNNDGKISRSEFEAIICKRFDQDVSQVGRASLEDLANLFKSFDRDGDGHIVAEDVHHLLVLLGGTTTQSILKLEVDKMDSDGDGKVSFAEFVKYVREAENDNVNRHGILSSSLNKLRGKSEMLRSKR